MFDQTSESDSHVQKYDIYAHARVRSRVEWVWCYLIQNLSRAMNLLLWMIRATTMNMNLTFSSHECFPFLSWRLGVGLCFSLSYQNPWNAQICYSLQSFEALNQRAVAVVVDPIQSVKGKVVIDAFRLINPQTMMLGQEPRQTTSNLGHLNKPSIQVSASQIVV